MNCKLNAFIPQKNITKVLHSPIVDDFHSDVVGLRRLGGHPRTLRPRSLACNTHRNA